MQSVTSFALFISISSLLSLFGNFYCEHGNDDDNIPCKDFSKWGMFLKNVWLQVSCGPWRNSTTLAVRTKGFTAVGVRRGKDFPAWDMNLNLPVIMNALFTKRMKGCEGDEATSMPANEGNYGRWMRIHINTKWREMKRWSWMKVNTELNTF